MIRTDIAIIGSGMGGGTMAYALKDSGAKVLIIERGHRLPAEPQNSDLDEVYLKGRYKNADTWYNGRTGEAFKPGVYYWVGGCTKVYGACLPRFRASDFEETQHQDGTSPAWPFSYADLEPYYTRAEQLFQVRGQIGEDPTEPAHSEAYPYPALDHEPAIQDLADSFRRQGLHPFRMANGLDADTPEKRALCATSDGAPNEAGLKSDAEKIAINPALRQGVNLMTDTKVIRLIPGPDGRTIVAALAERNDRIIRIEADKFILAAGAVNSAALLLGSATPEHPRRPGQLLRAGRPELHGAQQHLLHRHQPVQGQPDPVAKNPRPERLVRSRTHQPVPAGKPADARQAARQHAQDGPPWAPTSDPESHVGPQHRHLPHHRGPAPTEQRHHASSTAKSTSGGSRTTSSPTRNWSAGSAGPYGKPDIRSSSPSAWASRPTPTSAEQPWQDTIPPPASSPRTAAPTTWTTSGSWTAPSSPPRRPSTRP